MKKTKKLVADELRPAYERSDFGVLVRGKYTERLRKNSNVVVLDPEVADVFPNSASVNAALRALSEIASAPARCGVVLSRTLLSSWCGRPTNDQSA